MTEEERRPLVIHRNPHWAATNRHQIDASGEYSQIIAGPSVRHSNQEFDNNSISSESGAPSISVSKPVRDRSHLQNRAQRNRRIRLDCNLCGPAKGTILMCVVLERLAFYGLTGNLVLFLNKYPFIWESYHAMNAAFLFFGIAYIMSLIGGWIADSCLGRFKTLLLAFCIYCCGVVLMPFLAATSNTALNNTSVYNVILPTICLGSSNDTSLVVKTGPFDERCAWLIYLTLIVIAIGCGILKANICPFGSDQLAGAPHSVHFSFFNWYYWCVNIGSILAFSVVAYVEQQESFQIGYIICTGSLGCAFIIFLSGSYFYKFCPPHGSVFSNIFEIIQNAWHVKRQRKKERRLNDKIAECSDVREVATVTNISFLDHAKHQYGGIFHSSLVEDVKKLKLILAVFSVSVPYWLVYFQMQTTFLFQGLHMRLGSGKPRILNTSSPNYPLFNTSKENDHSFVVVAAWFTLFDAATVILLLPLLDRIIYPYLERKGYPFTFARRIIVGMIFALTSMVVAGVVEHFRLQAYWPTPDEPCVSHSIIQEIGNTIYYAADMSIFWQIPQYVLIGVSEVFASVACLQFAVSVAPKSMKALITGLYYLFMGIGSFSGTAIMSILSSSKIWFYDKNYGNINCRFPCKKNTDVDHACHLDYYFYLLAGLELIALLLFILITYCFDLNRIDQLISSRSVERPPRSGSVQKDEIVSAS